MTESQTDQQDLPMPSGTSKIDALKDHPLHKDNIPKYLYKYDCRFPASPIVVGSVEFVDGKIIQERAIEFRDENGETVWTDLRHTIPLSITQDDVRYTRVWLEEKYKPIHNLLINTRPNPTEYNTYPEPELIDETLTSFERMLGIDSSQE